jgi:hypothetical protein
MFLRIACFAFAIVMSCATARADQIPGHWCAPDGGRSIKIDYASIVTPGGKTVQGNITRHHVDFVIPDGEQDAGATFNADQLSDEQIRVTIVRKDGTSPPEIWTPCKPVS